MAGENILIEVRKGMDVQTTDGVRLGKVKEIWWGSDPTTGSPRCDEDVCSRIEVRRGFLGRDVHYIPVNAIAKVSGKSVVLNVDRATVDEKLWSFKPGWIGPGTDVKIHFDPPTAGPPVG